MKKALLILYLLTIAVGVYAIGVGVNRDNKNQKRHIILARQYEQTKKLRKQ